MKELLLRDRTSIPSVSTLVTPSSSLLRKPFPTPIITCFERPPSTLFVTLESSESATSNTLSTLTRKSTALSKSTLVSLVPQHSHRRLPVTLSPTPLPNSVSTSLSTKSRTRSPRTLQLVSNLPSITSSSSSLDGISRSSLESRLLSVPQ